MRIGFYLVGACAALAASVASAQSASTGGNETTHASGTQTDTPPPAGNPQQGTYGNPGMATPCTTMEGTPGTRTETSACRSSTNKNRNGYPKSDYDTGTATPSTQQPQ